MQLRFLLILCATVALQSDYVYSQSNSNTVSGPATGALIIIGGGRLDTTITNHFMRLAGGSEAKIVYIPTASGEEATSGDEFSERIKDRANRMGFGDVTILHTRDRNESESRAFVKPLLKATGVWISGGRQWRLADSYLNTRVHRELENLLKRGGVIAGSSAGATIQGSYLARGDTKANTIMVGDHEEGFGFVTNVAIDQHLLARNRQFDMFQILEQYPHLLGIGLDENTAIVVKGNEFEVIGRSYVVVYDGTIWSNDRASISKLPAGSEKFYLLNAGMRYDLTKRRIIQEPSN